jgi:trehalose-phosphatase
LEELKPSLRELIAEEEGFFLEDKGWSLALHARYADEATSERILQTAQLFLSEAKVGDDFVVLGGHKFLEICPISGNKGETVRYLLSEYPWPGAILVYMGDDDKDEEAFGVIKEFGGVTIQVILLGVDSQADCQLEDPEAVRSWLKTLIHRRENGVSVKQGSE